jgi:hypothetical protein
MTLAFTLRFSKKPLKIFEQKSGRIMYNFNKVILAAMLVFDSRATKEEMGKDLSRGVPPYAVYF